MEIVAAPNVERPEHETLVKLRLSRFGGVPITSVERPQSPAAPGTAFDVVVERPEDVGRFAFSVAPAPIEGEESECCLFVAEEPFELAAQREEGEIVAFGRIAATEEKRQEEPVDVSRSRLVQETPVEEDWQ